LRQHFKNVIEDTMKISSNIALFGNGGIGQLVSEIMLNNKQRPTVILDNNVKASSYKGIPIVKPTDKEQITGFESVLICSSVYHQQISDELLTNPLFEGINIIDPFMVASRIFIISYE